jgi:hypothetical protein
VTLAVKRARFMGLLPYVAAGAGFLAAGLGCGAWAWACGIAGAAAVAMQVSVIYRFYALVGARKELAWTYLLGSGVILVSLIVALGKLRRGAKVTWRGTGYASGSAK